MRRRRFWDKGLISASRETRRSVIKGIDPELEQQVTDIRGAMVSGSVEALTPAADQDAPGEHSTRDGILLGKDLATKLGVAVGDTVSVLTPQEMLTPNGLTLRPARLLRVAGIFSLGLYEFDSTYGYVSIDVAQAAVREGSRSISSSCGSTTSYRAPEVARAVLERSATTTPPRTGR